MREDFNELLGVVRTIVGDNTLSSRCHVAERLEQVIVRRRINNHRADYRAIDAPPPRTPSPYAVIDAQRNEEPADANTVQDLA